MRRLIAAIGLSMGSFFLAPMSGLAQVHPDVDRARQAALAGEFDRAVAAFERALARRDLSRDDILAIYEARVFIEFANGNDDAMRANLERIAALDPDHVFDADYFPVGVTAVFRDLVEARAGRLAARAEAVVLASGEFEVRGSTQNDPGDLTREVRVFGRGQGDDEWSSGFSEVRVDPGGAVVGEFYAEAVGPGGAVLARRGSSGAPATVDLTSAAVADDGGGVPLWVWIAGGVGLAAIATVIIIVAVTSGGVSDDTQPSGPMVRFTP